jgi:chorismate dehydratase
MLSETRIVTTNDGSDTLHSKEYDESYHSVNGAINEAFFKFAAPCRIDALANSGTVTILDIGFGLGYNVLAAIHTAKEADPECTINIVSLEKEPVHVKALDSLSIPEPFKPHYNIVKRAAGELHHDENGINITILTGDARQSIRILTQKFDAVFLDPFSVTKNVELWTVEFFKEIYLRMTDKAILATYSASTPVRCGLMEAGFNIGPGPGDGMKRGGTLATKAAGIPRFSEKEVQKFNTSPQRRPFYDPGLNFTKEEIIKHRKNKLEA